jgi:hypothetical protein
MAETGSSFRSRQGLGRITVVHLFSLMACSAFLMEGCYVEKLVSDGDLTIQEEERLVSYRKTDGRSIEVPPPSLRYKDAVIREDTLSIAMTGHNPGQNNKIIYYNKIPLSEIYSITLLSTHDRLRYASIGGGYGTGTYFSGGYTHINNQFGFTISARELWYRARDLPSDYTGFYKNNNMTTVAGMFVFEAKPDRNIWLGLELGPSFVNFRKEVETPNPDYGTGWFIFVDLDKYYRDNIISNTIGLSGRLKFDYMFLNFMGVELAFYCNLNKYKPVFGFETFLLFGKTR